MSKRKSILAEAFYVPRMPRRFWRSESRDRWKMKFRSESIRAAFVELARLEMVSIRAVNPNKWCGTCRQILSTAEHFYPDDHQNDGWFWECKACRQWRKRSPRQRVRDLVWKGKV